MGFPIADRDHESRVTPEERHPHPALPLKGRENILWRRRENILSKRGMLLTPA
jgi:hypothetical protein